MTIIILLSLLIFLKIRVNTSYSTSTVEKSIEVITGKSQGSRINAVFSILENKDQNKIDSILKPYGKQLLTMLQDEDPLIRKWGIIFLKELKYKGAVNCLILMLNDSNYDVAYNAARALGSMGSRRAIKPLLKILKEKNHWYFRLNAYCALKKLGWKQ